MKKVVLYARESPSLAENEDTIESQISAIVEKIKEDNNEIVDQYRDNGWAGDLLARPDLDRLRDDAEQHKFEVVYIFDRSRLARKYWLQELILEELEEKGIAVSFLKEPEVKNEEDKVVQGIKGLFAEYERTKITERTRRGRLFRAKNGKIVGHEAPYGYRYIRPDRDKEERWFEINEEEAKVIRLIFNWLAYEGLSIRGIIKQLYDMKIRPREGKDNWVSSTLSRLVRREDYIGNSFYNKTIGIIPLKSQTGNGYKRRKKTSRKYKPRDEWLPIKVPQIIDNETFNLAQQQLLRNQELSPRNIKRKYLLRGLIFCNECKARFAGETTRDTQYYRSTLRLRNYPNKADCICTSINAKKIEFVVWNEIKKLLCNPNLIKAQFNRRYKNITDNKEAVKEQIEDINKKINLLNLSEKRLIDGYSAGVISLEQIKDKINLIKLERTSLINEKEKLLNNLATVKYEGFLNNIDKVCKNFNNLLKKINDEDKDKILHLLLKEIFLKRENVIIRGYIPLKVPQMQVLSSNTYYCWSSQ